MGGKENGVLPLECIEASALKVWSLFQQARPVGSVPFFNLFSEATLGVRLRRWENGKSKKAMKYLFSETIRGCRRHSVAKRRIWVIGGSNPVV